MERLYVIFVLVFTSSAIVGLSTEPVEVTERLPGTVGQLALTVFAYLPAGTLILRHWHSFLRGVVDCKWAIAILVLALASGLWADDPLFVFRKSLILAANMAFAIYFGTRYTRDEQIGLLFYAVTLITAMSLLTVALFPQYGIDHYTNVGAWRGVFATKNVLGKVTVLGALALCLSSRKWVKSEVLRFVLLTGLSAVIVLSESKTAAVVGAVMLVLMLMYSFLRSRVIVLIPIMSLALLVLVAGWLAYSDSEYRAVLLDLFGRDETLTGRTELSDAVLAAIGTKPLLGYGFMSFWNGVAGPSASILDAVHWVPPHAHNGFLDLWLELGALGLVTFGIGFVLRFRTAILEYRALGSRTAMWPLAFLSFMLLYNLTESSLLSVNSLYWSLYVASLVREVNCGLRLEQNGDVAGKAQHNGGGEPSCLARNEPIK